MNFFDYIAEMVFVWGFQMPRLVLIIIEIIGVLWFGSMIRYTCKLMPIQIDLEKAVKTVDSFKTPVTGDSLEQLRQDLSERKYIAGQWSEFCETLVPQQLADGSIVIYNTFRASVFFNTESVIEHALNLSLYQALPGIFTGLGLIGTFGAIFLGLHELHFSVDGQVAGIEKFIGDLSGKFLSSLFGLLFALLSIAWQKYSIGRVSNLCLHLQNKIDRLFPQKVSAEILDRILGKIEEQTASFSIFTSQFADDLKAGFKESMDPAMERMVDAINQLTVATGRLQEQKEQSAGELIERIVQTFQDSLTASANTEIAKLSQSLVHVSEMTESMGLKMESFVQQTGEQHKQQVADIDAAMKSTLATVDERLAEHHEIALRETEAVGEALNVVLQNFNESASLHMASVKQVVGDLISRHEIWSKDFNDRFSANIAQQLEFNQSLHKRIGDTMHQFIAETGEAMKQIVNQASEWTNQVESTLKEVADYTSTEVKGLNSANKSLTKAMVSLETAVSSTGDFVNELKEWSESNENSIKAVSSHIDKLLSTQETNQKGVEEIVTCLNKSDEIVKEFQRLLHQHNQVYDTLDQRIGQTLKVINDSVREYSDNTYENLGKYISEFDKVLAQAANSLNGAVGELDDRLGDLTEVIERNVGPNGKGSGGSR